MIFIYISPLKIDSEEEYEKIYQFIIENESVDWSNKYSFNTIKMVIQKVGLHKSLKYLHSLSLLLCNGGKFIDSLFDTFIILISQENIITIQDIERINYLELNRNNNFTGTATSMPQSVFSLRGTPLNIPSTRNEGHQKNQTPKLFAQGESLFSNKGSLSPNKPIEIAVKSNRIGKSTGINLNPRSKNDEVDSNETYANSGQISPLERLEGKKLNFVHELRNSLEYSDLAISSYSMRSGVFKDSFSDNIFSRNDISEYNLFNKNEEDYHIELYEEPDILQRMKLTKKLLDEAKPVDKLDIMLASNAINSKNRTRKGSEEENIRRRRKKSQLNIHVNVVSRSVEI